jgi:hypothetical protein
MAIRPKEMSMDRSRFDDLTRAIAAPVSRRFAIAAAGRTIAAAFGLGLAVSPRLRPEQAEAAACRAEGVSCTTHSQCCSGTCNPKDSRGRRTCSCDADLQTDPDNCGSCGHICTGTPNGYPICNSGHCNVACNEGYFRDPLTSTCLPKLATKSACTANEQCAGGVCACTSGLCTTSYCMDYCIGGGNALVVTRTGSQYACVADGLVFADCSTQDCPPSKPICGYTHNFCQAFP